jgi:hypothetical protein
MTNSTAMRVTGGVLLIAFLAMVMLVAKSPDRFLYDEPFFADYVLLLHKYGFTPKFLNSLNAAPGPLSGVIQVIFEPLTRLRPVAMRFVNTLLLIFLALVLAMWLKRERGDYWVSSFSVLVVPMTWVVAGMALSEMSAMVFVTLSLYLQLRGLDAFEKGFSTPLWFLAAGVCIGIAVWGRQPYLLLGGVPVLVALMERRLCGSVVVFVSTLIVIATPLFLIWGGPLPPSQHLAPAGFSIIHGLTSFGYAGICFILLGARPWVPVKIALSLVALTFLSNAVLSAFALYPVQSMVDRYLPTAVMPLYGNLFGSLVLSSGVLFMVFLLKTTWESRKNLKQLTVNAGLLCAAASPIFIGHLYSSRYTAMSLPYLILSVQPWRQWSCRTMLMSALGCGIGFLSLYGYFFSQT